MTPKLPRTKVWTITCPECRVEMYSRAPHDFRMCGCPANTMVDGGFSGYVRYGGKNLEAIRKTFRYRYLKATAQELYNDWNTETDAYGLFSSKEHRSSRKKEIHAKTV